MKHDKHDKVNTILMTNWKKKKSLFIFLLKHKDPLAGQEWQPAQLNSDSFVIHDCWRQKFASQCTVFQSQEPAGTI